LMSGTMCSPWHSWWRGLARPCEKKGAGSTCWMTIRASVSYYFFLKKNKEPPISTQVFWVRIRIYFFYDIWNKRIFWLPISHQQGLCMSACKFTLPWLHSLKFQLPKL
jgi:hypothetical protein